MTGPKDTGGQVVDLADRRGQQRATIRQDAILECIADVERTLPAHEDHGCCSGLRQVILSRLRERLADSATDHRRVIPPPGGE